MPQYPTPPLHQADSSETFLRPATVHLVLLNPAANRGRAAKQAQPLGALLHEMGCTAPLIQPASIDEAIALLADLPKGSRVIIGSGDGSLQHYVSALLAQQLELALLPLGCHNHLAHDLGMTGLQQSLKAALTQPATRMDLGRVIWVPRFLTTQNNLQNDHFDRWFIASCASGWHAQVAWYAGRAPAWWSLPMRYRWAMLKMGLRLKRWQVQIFTDQQRLYQGECLMTSVLNTKTYGSGTNINPKGQIDDGYLEHVLVTASSRQATLRTLKHLFINPTPNEQHLTRLKEAWIQSTTPMPLAVDGEFVGMTQQFRIQVYPKMLKVVHSVTNTIDLFS